MSEVDAISTIIDERLSRCKRMIFGSGRIPDLECITNESLMKALEVPDDLRDVDFTRLYFDADRVGGIRSTSYVGNFVNFYGYVAWPEVDEATKCRLGTAHMRISTMELFSRGKDVVEGIMADVRRAYLYRFAYENDRRIPPWLEVASTADEMSRLSYLINPSPMPERMVVFMRDDEEGAGEDPRMRERRLGVEEERERRIRERLDRELDLVGDGGLGVIERISAVILGDLYEGLKLD